MARRKRSNVFDRLLFVTQVLFRDGKKSFMDGRSILQKFVILHLYSWINIKDKDERWRHGQSQCWHFDLRFEVQNVTFNLVPVSVAFSKSTLPLVCFTGPAMAPRHAFAHWAVVVKCNYFFASFLASLLLLSEEELWRQLLQFQPHFSKLFC